MKRLLSCTVVLFIIYTRKRPYNACLVTQMFRVQVKHFAFTDIFSCYASFNLFYVACILKRNHFPPRDSKRGQSFYLGNTVKVVITSLKEE